MLFLVAMVVAKGEMRWTRRWPPLQKISPQRLVNSVGKADRPVLRASSFGLARHGRFLEGHFEAAFIIALHTSTPSSLITHVFAVSSTLQHSALSNSGTDVHSEGVLASFTGVAALCTPTNTLHHGSEP